MKYIVLHYSQNWMMDGLACFSFDTLKEAKLYVSNFKGKGHSHREDHIQIVQVIDEFNSVQISENLYGFRIK